MDIHILDILGVWIVDIHLGCGLWTSIVDIHFCLDIHIVDIHLECGLWKSIGVWIVDTHFFSRPEFFCGFLESTGERLYKTCKTKKKTKTLSICANLLI